MAKEKICGIYCIENKVNGKKYIGKSKDINRRWRQHLRFLNKGTHYNSHLQNSWELNGGEKFNFFILEELELDKLPNAELYYIKKFKTTDDNFGYNMTASVQKNVKYNDGLLKQMRDVNPNKIPIVQISLDGEYVKHWESARYASKVTSILQPTIRVSLNNKGSHAGGFVWIYESEYNEDEFDIDSFVFKCKNSNNKRIIMLELNFNVIKVFNNLSDASRELNVDKDLIYSCCVHKSMHVKYRRFEYYHNYKIGKINKKEFKNDKAIVYKEKTIYRNLKFLEKDIDVPYSTLYSRLKNQKNVDVRRATNDEIIEYFYDTNDIKIDINLN